MENVGNRNGKGVTVQSACKTCVKSMIENRWNDS